MDDKSPLIQLYILFSYKTDKQQDQRQIPVKDNKDGILTGPPIYAAILWIIRKPYGGQINPKEFCNCLEQARQISKHRGRANQWLRRG